MSGILVRGKPHTQIHLSGVALACKSIHRRIHYLDSKRIRILDILFRFRVAIGRVLPITYVPWLAILSQIR